MKEYNKYYWGNKDARAKQAKEHTKEMQMKYCKEIKECSAKTKIYTGPFSKECGPAPISGYPNNIKYEVVEMDSVSAIFSESEGVTAVLNFASYKFPGGGFLYGSRAQEECLCHESFLYNVLANHQSYYDFNKKNLNRALYKDRALYSPNVIFEKNGNTQKCNVITCAAPNFSTASNFVSRIENDKVLLKRICFILEIAKREKIETLILGAFGCGGATCC